MKKMVRKNVPLRTTVLVDEFTKVASKCFDFEFNGISEVFPYELPKELLGDFKIGVIVGGSGSGKSTLLEEFGTEESLEYNDQSILSNFSDPNQAVERLCSVGLSSVPTWVKPYRVLSNGEKFRVDLARRIKDNAVIDEFTSVVDRDVAISSSVSVSKYIKRENIKNVVFATCHRDIIEYLEPCWVIDTDLGVWYHAKEYLRKPKINIDIRESDYKTWEYFKKHHYLTESINKASKCFVCEWHGRVVGFISILTAPNGYVRNAYRVHRLVVLPEFQGLGIGTKILEAVCSEYLKNGNRIFIKTAHQKLGVFLEGSKQWVATSHNKQKRTESEKMLAKRWHGYKLDTKRECYTYEYVGGSFFEKQHYRIAIKIYDGATYNLFEKKIENIIAENSDKYIVFVSLEVGRENHADTYAKERSIRREFFGKNTKYDILLEIKEEPIEN